LHKIAKEENLWFHVDAVNGGGAFISSKYQSCLVGIEMSDSNTHDLHKWFSVPMGTSLFLSRHKQILHRSFAIKTHYMTDDGDPNLIVDPYLHSIQWSRRFIGLKIYLPLAIHGWKGYEKVIDNQVQLGITLKKMLMEKGWEIMNHSPLPIICFSRKEYKTNEMHHIVDTINSSGKMWLSVYPIHGKGTGRICITNYATGITELYECIDLLSMAKNNISIL
jgi:glutamate/tyrosine decarboxylase-like PLP-dependent enzyme